MLVRISEKENLQSPIFVVHAEDSNIPSNNQEWFNLAIEFLHEFSNNKSNSCVCFDDNIMDGVYYS